MKRAIRPKPRPWRRIGLAAIGLATALLTGTAVSHLSFSEPADADEPGVALTDPCLTVFGAVGSSHTDGGYPISGTIADDGDGVPGTYLRYDNVVHTSWAYYTTQDPQLVLDGGWALGGSRVEDLADKIEPGMFRPGSLVVILAGTVDNMPEYMLPASESMQHWPRLIEATGAPKEKILIVNLPPMRHLEDRIIDYNTQLEEFATAEGIRLFDLHALTSDGHQWRPGYDADGAHFTPEVARIIGEAIADDLTDMAGCSATEPAGERSPTPRMTP